MTDLDRLLEFIDKNPGYVIYAGYEIFGQLVINGVQAVRCDYLADYSIVALSPEFMAKNRKWL